MHASSILLSLAFAFTALAHPSSASGSAAPTCKFTPSDNATVDNYPGGPTYAEEMSPYDLNKLSEVPIADTCNSGDPEDELACAREFIDAIDEQIAYLYARRLGFAAVAGNAKYKAGKPLNEPARNDEVAEGMALRVLNYGGSADAGRVMGGEGCQIFASLEFEAASIRKSCDPSFAEDISRSCQ